LLGVAADSIKKKPVIEVEVEVGLSRKKGVELQSVSEP
jgi:hypothetical protein